MKGALIELIVARESEMGSAGIEGSGRVKLVLENGGEEAQAVGSAAALAPEDWVWPQYRELGVIFWRGYTMEECANRACAHALSARLSCSRRHTLSPLPLSLSLRRMLP